MNATDPATAVLALRVPVAVAEAVRRIAREEGVPYGRVLRAIVQDELARRGAIHPKFGA